MAVARTHHNKNYTCMSNYHFQDRQLSLKAKGLLSLMLSLPDTWDYSISGLASLSSDGETSVRSAVKELEEHNYLKRTPIREGGKIVDWEYDIYETPLEILDVENPQVESPPLENKDNKVLTQTNTKQKNKNKKTTEFSFGGRTTPVKENLYTKCVNLIDSNSFDCSIRKLLIEYLSFRLSIKDKPLYYNMWKGMLSKLQELCKDGKYSYEEVIKQSIERGYLSFYPISSGGSSVKKNTAWESGVSSEQYTEDELIKLEEGGGEEWF